MALLTVHYHELALKRANRPRFERALRENLRRALSALGPCRVRSLPGRILVQTEADVSAALARVARVCGVAYALPIDRLPLDPRAVADLVVGRLAGREVTSFRISSKRADKSYPLTSVDLNREIGALVHEATGIPVRLRGPEVEVLVSVLPDAMLVGFEKSEGPGGLPVGTGGRVAVLMSGGIDSPVAAWRMMRRGCRCDLVHFHSHPLVDRTTQEKAQDLAEVLNEWQFRTRLHLVPLARIQSAIRVRCPEALRVVLYRRFMVRVAERIARRRRCGALVTGESLGQVASQTLRNLAAVDAVAGMPILRPLIGNDKQEIIREAERLETYAISIRPDQDCCSLFVPRRPATSTTPRVAAEAERPLEVDELVQDAVDRTAAIDYG